MLDTIKIGLLRLNTRDKPPGYVRVVPKSNPLGDEVTSYFRIPLHVAFDMEGYNSYKEYLQQEKTDFKTWISNVQLAIPPSPDNAKYYPNAAHEWFLGNVRDLANEYPIFPSKIRRYVENAIDDYLQLTREPEISDYDDDYVTTTMSKSQEMAARKAVHLYSMLQRSRFDLGRPEKRGEFLIRPFYRVKGDKSALEIIEEVVQAVSNYVLRNPKVSKYSETESKGLKIKLTVLLLECFYKEQLRFMKSKLEAAMNQRR